MSKQLYIASDLRSSDLLGAFWAENLYEAQRYFEVAHPFLGDELCVELASESDLSEEDLIDEFPEAFIEEDLTEDAMSTDFFIDKHAGIRTDVDALLGEGKSRTEAENEETLVESVVSIADLDVKLQPLSDEEILAFMSRLRGGTYFNMGMFSVIKPNAANKHKRIYKVMNMSAIVSGIDYENVGTTKDFRDRTGDGPGSSWYNHKDGFEHRVGVSKKSPDKQYVLWKYDDKKGRSVEVWYFIVDTLDGTVEPVSLEALLESTILTNSVKESLKPKKVTGIDKTTGELITNDTNWRTAAFEHIFWLSQSGKAPLTLGARFMESLETEDTLTESDKFFVDKHAHIDTDVDSILSSKVVESTEKSLEDTSKAEMPGDDGIDSKTKKLKESYRRTISRGATLIDNELFVDFD